MKRLFYSLILLVAALQLSLQSLAQCSVPSGTVGVTPATYGYTIVDSAGTTTLTLTPDVASTGATLYINNAYIGPGTANGSGGYTWTAPLPQGANVSFYFLFMSGGQQQTQTYNYTVGSCGSVTSGSPVVSITSPLANAAYTAPATITINANATANTGSNITLVEFYAKQGATNALIGSSTTAPYSFTWTNVPAGVYTLTAVATDDSNRTTTSAPVSIIVSNPAPAGYCGSGTTNSTGDADYYWSAVTTPTDTVTITFHPVNRTVGSDLVIWNSNLGGILMDMQPNGDFTKVVNVGANTLLTFYFTYRIGAGGPETNTSATPHTYTKGADCIAAMPVIFSDYSVKQLGKNTVSVSWATLSELNNKYFIVEKSVDGRTFSNLGYVSAKGYSNEKQYYSITDKEYFGGIAYYRVSQVDKDGKKTIYGVKSINAPASQVEGVYPNPVKSSTFFVKMTSVSNEIVPVRLLSTAGKTIYSGNCVPQGQVLRVVLPSKLPSGLYILSAQGKTFKVIVE